MKYRSRALLCQLSSFSLQAYCQDSGTGEAGSIADVESQFLFINMLEFLGEFELENGEWISPETLSNEVFSDIDAVNAAEAQNVLSVTDDDD
jgi:hypothetical protein